MNKICNFKNAFRILKGGKVSLVVSAMLIGCTVQATTTISSPVSSLIPPIGNPAWMATGVNRMPLDDLIINADITLQNITDTYAAFNYLSGVFSTAMADNNSITLNSGHTISVSGNSGFGYEYGIEFGFGLGLGATGETPTSGHIINNGSIIISAINGNGSNSGNGTGIYVGGDVQQSSTITNNGIITVSAGNSGYGIEVGGDIITNSTVDNTSNGTISVDAGGYAIGMRLYNLGVLPVDGEPVDTSSALNHGTINVISSDSEAFGILANVISNAALIENSGTMNVQGYNEADGIFTYSLYDNAKINNSGTLSVTSDWSWAYGISIDAAIYGNSQINNSGTITATAPNGTAMGIYVEGLYDNTQINNSGTITATSGDGYGIGIKVPNLYGSSQINNSGTINVAATNGKAFGIGYDWTYLKDDSTITNSGTISVNSDQASYGIRAIFYSTTQSIVTNSGTITAKVNGEYDATGFAVNIGNEGNYVGIVNNTATGVLRGNIYVQGTLNNDGLISLPYNADLADLSGNYAYARTFNQSATGKLEIGLMSGSDGVPHYSQLYADNAHFASNSTIAVNVLTASANQSLLVGQTLHDVVSTPTGQLTLDGPLKITDNSALLNFSYLVNGTYDVSTQTTTEGDNTIDLVAEQGQTIAEATEAGGKNKSVPAAKALDNAKDIPAMAPFIAKLNNCETNECVAKAVASTTPQNHVSTQIAGTHVLNNVQGIVELRQNSTLGGGGLNSGDKTLTEQNFWLKPFGSIGNQNDKDGINGFDFKMKGLGIGYDAEYKTNQRSGFALFATDANVDVNNSSQTSDVSVYNIIAYGNIPLNETNNFLYQAGYAWQKNEGERNISLINETAHSDYTSQAASLDLKLMQTYQLDDKITIHPLAEATYRRFMTPSYNETGADAMNLHADKTTSEHYLLGGGVITDYKIDKTSNLMLDLNLMYDFNHGVESVTAAYEGASGIKFSTDGIDNGPLVYNIGTGYTMKTSNNTELNFMYNYQGQGSTFDTHTVSAKYVLKF